jgi:hypothetical protein
VDALGGDGLLIVFELSAGLAVLGLSIPLLLVLTVDVPGSRTVT